MGLDFLPLYENAVALIRANLETIQSDGRPLRCHLQAYASAACLFNQHRWEHNAELPAIEAEVLFIGQHVYNSRIKGDNYTSTTLCRIVSSMSEASAIIGNLPTGFFKIPFRESTGWGRSIVSLFSSADKHPGRSFFGNSRRPINRKEREAARRPPLSMLFSTSPANWPSGAPLLKPLTGKKRRFASEDLRQLAEARTDLISVIPIVYGEKAVFLD